MSELDKFAWNLRCTCLHASLSPFFTALQEALPRDVVRFTWVVHLQIGFGSEGETFATLIFSEHPLEGEQTVILLKTY